VDVDPVETCCGGIPPAHNWVRLDPVSRHGLPGTGRRGTQGRAGRGALVQLEDSELTAAIGEGDIEAEAELFRRFHPRVLRKAQAVLGGGPDCEDLASEILQAAIANLRGGRFRGECRLSTFVHAIARNKVAEFLRRRRPAMADLTEDLRDPAPPPDEAARRAEMAAAIRIAVARLKPKYRNVLYLYYYRGFSVAEIAGRLGSTNRRISEWKDYGLRVIRAQFGSVLEEFR